MKILGLAGAALLAASAPALAQGLPAPPPFRNAPPPYEAPAAAVPPWMQDDGSSSDYPTHYPSDFTADGLNQHYRNGFTILPAPGGPE